MKEPKDYPHYSKMTNVQIIRELNGFKKYALQMRGFLQIDLCHIDCNEKTLLEIVERVFKRKIYYHVFHGIENLNIIKETALYCFWLNKLQPFTINFETGETNNRINAKIALNLLKQSLYAYAEQEHKQVNLNESILQNLFYSLLYNDLSKEAIIDIAESLIVDKRHNKV